MIYMYFILFLDKWCDWREILKAELERNDSSFYYQEVRLDLFLNVTIVTDIGPLITRCTVTREFFKTIISLDLQSKVQMNFVLKLLQRLVGKLFLHSICSELKIHFSNFMLRRVLLL